MTTQSFYTSDQIVRHSSGYTHFFDADSKRFFNSRIGYNAYPTVNPFITLFVTSERCTWNDRYEQQWKTVYTAPNGDLIRDRVSVFMGEKRMYSIRSYDSRTHSIDTIGEFQAYSNGKTANNEAKRLAKIWEFLMDDMQEYATILNMELDQQNRRNLGRNKIVQTKLGSLYVANVG